MSREQIELGRIAVLVLLIFAVGASEYTGRVGLVSSQRAECELRKRDRLDNAAGWRVGEESQRRRAFFAPTSAERTDDLVGAEAWAAVARNLETRAKVNCKTAYPDAWIIPFKHHRVPTGA